jgi:cytochrome c oxidase subunit 2
MGILPNASEHGITIDHALEFCHWFMLVLFIGWSAYFMYAIFRFHYSRHPKANYHGVKSKVSAHLELSVVLIEAILLLGFALPLWGHRVSEFPDKEHPLRVRAIGEQFLWNFHYAGVDGVFGRQDAKYITGTNPLGLDPNDPHLVNFRPTVIEVSSKDVIHSLSLQHMRMDQDAIPGSRIPMWFRPIKEGQYEIICAQLCGAGHYSMKAEMTVEDETAFNKFQKEQLSLRGPAAAAAAAAAPEGAEKPAPPVIQRESATPLPPPAK